jgi:iron-sulfur cluster assembly protein
MEMPTDTDLISKVRDVLEACARELKTITFGEIEKRVGWGEDCRMEEVFRFGKFNLLRFETGSQNMMTARLRPQMMRLTDAAADRIKSVMANAGRPIVGVRVGVKNGGCAGMAYTMEYAEQVEPSDEVVEDKGVRVLIDPKAVLFLLGTEMGYKVEKLAAQFVFNNPNQTSACGCGESVQLTPATETH